MFDVPFQYFIFHKKSKSALFWETKLLSPSQITGLALLVYHYHTPLGNFPDLISEFLGDFILNVHLMFTI